MSAASSAVVAEPKRRSSTHRPLVSIVVPVLNGERYLAESLDSILAQTYSPIEVIVMDDASTDATPEIVASYGGRIRYHRQTRTRGTYHNVNDGLGLADGELIATYHSDDVYDATIVEREVDFLENHPEVGGVFCKDFFIAPDGGRLGALRLPPELPCDAPLRYEALLPALLRHKNVMLRCPSAMVRASVYREVGGYRQSEFKIATDLEMWVRIARRYPLAILDAYLFSYRCCHGGWSDRYEHLRLEPDAQFMVLDMELDRLGTAQVPQDALAAYQAHKAADTLRVAAANYVAGRSDETRRLIKSVRASDFVGSPAISRAQSLVLLGLLRIAARLPRMTPVSWLFHRRLSRTGRPRRRALGAMAR